MLLGIVSKRFDTCVVQQSKINNKCVITTHEHTSFFNNIVRKSRLIPSPVELLTSSTRT